jgi:hypothetical protein
VLLAALVLVQAALVSVSFPLSEVLTAKPILHIDSAYHAYQIEVARILWDTHAVVGYDPYFAAGYVGGIPFNGSARVPAVLGLFLSGPAAPFIALKIFLFVTSFCASLPSRWRAARWVSASAPLALQVYSGC